MSALHVISDHCATFFPGDGRSANTTILAVSIAIVVAFIAVAVAAQWKMFVKAGRPGWAAIVPVYQSWVLFEICGKPGWWALFGIIPYLGWVVVFLLYIPAAFELARRFGKDRVFAIVWLILFQVVGFIMLGFGDAAYDASVKEQSFKSPNEE